LHLLPKVTRGVPAAGTVGQAHSNVGKPGYLLLHAQLFAVLQPINKVTKGTRTRRISA
jgi:hypothetical protein